MLPPFSPVKTELVSVFTSDGVRLDGALYTPEKAHIKTRVGILFIFYQAKAMTEWLWKGMP